MTVRSFWLVSLNHRPVPFVEIAIPWSLKKDPVTLKREQQEGIPKSPPSCFWCGWSGRPHAGLAFREWDKVGDVLFHGELSGKVLPIPRVPDSGSLTSSGYPGNVTHGSREHAGELIICIGIL